MEFIFFQTLAILKVSIAADVEGHLARFGKEPWEVSYDRFGYCDMCNTRIDEFGYCACGGAAD